MTSTVALIDRVRRELGDFGHPFRDTFVGTGQESPNGADAVWDLVETQITDATVTAVYPPPTPSVQSLTANVDYALDSVGGQIILLNTALIPLPAGVQLIINGNTAGMFTDDELSDYVKDAFVQHTSGRYAQQRYRDGDGFIKYTNEPMDYSSLPREEDYLVALLATVMVLWSIATDASTDIDVSTADGTSIPRSQRYAQVRSQIDAKTAQYELLCSKLNVGLGRIEVSSLRRVSRTTGRLVPIFVEREYDDNSLPDRILPPIDERNKDDSGIASPWWGGVWG